jgi:glutaredoxin
VRAKGIVRDAGFHFEELLLNWDYTDATLRAVSGRSTVPEIFINGDFIGGAEELETYLHKAEAA